VRYVALLRGVNVGGNTLIKMAELRSCVEELEVKDVSTYIASGNVLFNAAAGRAEALEREIERAIDRRLGLRVTVIVLDRPRFGRIVKAIPPAWAGDKSVRANVAFLRRGTDAKAVAKDLDPDPDVDEVKAVSGAILWATKRNALTRSVMRKLIAGAAYKQLTVRSVSTTMKLQELLAR
jgi:uncharacterized protein (DUF1697 family)